MRRSFLLLLILLNPILGFTQNPEINAVLVNACSLSEGIDELVVFTNGNSNLDINTISITFPSITPYCNSSCGTKTLINNPTYVNSLNTLAGCSLFQYSTTIPPNAKVIIFTGLNPSIVYDYASECGNGPYYVIFCNNTSTTGRFANNAGANRTLSIDFGASTDMVTYFSSNANTGDDGDYVTFANDGTPTYSNIGTCAIPLPIELVDFNGYNVENINKIYWVTVSELNNDYFILETSIDGYQWDIIGKLDGAGTSNVGVIYDFYHKDYKDTINYYRLSQFDFDGNNREYGIISINNTLKSKHIVKRVNLMGLEVNENYRGLVIEIYNDGLYKKTMRN